MAPERKLDVLGMSDLMTLASVVLGKHGRDLWRQPARFEAYLRDYVGENGFFYNAENALLLAILRGGCLSSLSGSSNFVSAERQRQVAEVFVQKQGFPLEKVRSAFAIWAKAIGLNLEQVTNADRHGNVTQRPQVIELRSRVPVPTRMPPPRSAVPGKQARVVKAPQQGGAVAAGGTQMGNVVGTGGQLQTHYVHYIDPLTRASPQMLLLLVVEINAWYLAYFLVFFGPLFFLMFGLIRSLMSDGGTFLAGILAACAASWAAFRFGRQRFKQVFLKRMTHLLGL